jgi:uncharacterized protein involved in exopolysaccharide biosynthesis
VVSPDQGDGFFEVHFRDSDPEHARDVVRFLLNEFVSRNVTHNEQELRHAGKFLDDQIASYETMLSDSQAKIAAFRARNPRFATVTNGTMTTGASEGGSPDLAAARAAYEVALAQAGGAARATPAAVASANAERVNSLEAKLASLRTEYTEQYPDVVATKRQLSEAKAKLASEAPSAPAAAAASPDGSALDAARRRLEMAQRASAPRVVAAPVMPAALQSEWNELQRNDEVLRMNYQQLISRREAARLSEAVDGAEGSGKYQITRQPTTPMLPTGPKRGLYLGVVAAASLFAGLAAAYVRAAVTGIFVSPRELESAFQLPVVGTVAWEPAWSTKPRLRSRHPMTGIRTALGRGVAALTFRSLH